MAIYPNLIEEYIESPWHYSTFCSGVGVTSELFFEILKGNEEFTYGEMEKFRYYIHCNQGLPSCSYDYLFAPKLSLMSRKKRALELLHAVKKIDRVVKEIAELEPNPCGYIEKNLQEIHKVRCELVGNEPITYAKYRWALYRVHSMQISINASLDRKNVRGLSWKKEC